MLTAQVPLDDYIQLISRGLAQKVLNCANTTLRKDVKTITQLNTLFEIPEWDYRPYDRGFSRGTMTVLWLFRQSVIRVGRKQAILKFESTLNEARKLSRGN